MHLAIFAKKDFMKKILLLSNALVFPLLLNAQNESDSVILEQNQRFMQLIENNQVSTQIFIGYRYYNEGNGGFNEFSVKRGYITFQKKLNNNLSGRITPDLTVDRDGDGEGDLEMRLKYCYIQLNVDGNYGFLTNPEILVGEIPTPWVEFEEKLNGYRVVASQYLDDMEIFSSADFGATASVLLGGTVDESYQRSVSNAYPGKYGSIAIGIYNGGGYHSIEKNNNKTLQWRTTFRPFPSTLPGMQLSYTGAFGKGNTSLYPEWETHSGIFSFQSSALVFTGQLFTTLGNFDGTLADVSGNSYRAKGWNSFAEIKLWKKKMSIFGSYGVMRYDASGTNFEMVRQIAGVAYHIYKKNKVVIDLHRNIANGSAIGVIEIMFELAL